jgi:PAS domain S-box-containing protein
MSHVEEPENYAGLVAENTRLRESEARLRGLFEHCQEGFVLGEPLYFPDGNTDFRYVEVNKAWEELVGISRADVVGRTVREVQPGIADEWLLFLSEIMEEGTPLQFSRHVVATDRWIDVTMFQPCEGLVAILFRDITERKRAFDRLRESEENYKHTVELHPQAAWTARPAGLNGREPGESERTGLSACTPTIGSAPWTHGATPQQEASPLISTIGQR